MNSSFIQAVNGYLANVFPAQSRIFGLGETIIRYAGEEQTFFPAIINLHGEAIPVDVNTDFPVTIYHRQLGAVISDKPNSSYGNGPDLKIYSYSNALIVHIFGDLLKKTVDEILILIEANIPQFIKIENVKSTKISLTSANLNTISVFNSEYKNVPYRLPLNYFMMSITYKVEAIIDKTCLPKC